MKSNPLVWMPEALSLMYFARSEPGWPVPSPESVRQDRKPATGNPMSATPATALRNRYGSDNIDMTAAP